MRGRRGEPIASWEFGAQRAGCMFPLSRNRGIRAVDLAVGSGYIVSGFAFDATEEVAA